MRFILLGKVRRGPPARRAGLARGQAGFCSALFSSALSRVPRGEARPSGRLGTGMETALHTSPSLGAPATLTL